MSPRRRPSGALLRPALSVCAALLLAATALAAGYGSVEVNAELTPAVDGIQPFVHGYPTYAVRVQNRGVLPVRVGLALPARSSGLVGNCIERVDRATLVEPGATVVVNFPVPPLPINGGGISVTIDGDRQQEPVMCSFAPIGGGHGGPGSQPRVLFSRGAPLALRPLLQTPAKPAAAHASGGRPAPSEPECIVLAARDPVDSWPAEWRAYTPYDGVVLTAPEWKALDPAARTALTRYAECGGSLLLFGEAPPLGAQTVPFVVEGVSLRPLGFGVWMSVPAPAGAGPPLTNEQTRFLINTWQGINRDATDGLDEYEANSRFPVVPNVEIPVGGLLVLMLIFVILVGPVNIIVLSRMKRRIWLFWTSPLISLATALAVTVYALFSEGWSATIRTASVTLLDETSHRATTIGWTGYYAPLTPGGGLNYSHSAEITPLVRASMWHGDGSPRTVELADRQRLATGWVSARVPAHVRVRKSEDRRERLAVSATSAGLRVVNGLGAPVKRLLLVDHQGRFYEAASLAPGAEITIPAQASGKAVGGGVLSRSLINNRWPDCVSEIVKDPAQRLRATGVRGSYIAILDESPFLESGLSSHKEWKRQCVVFGVMKEPTDAR